MTDAEAVNASVEAIRNLNERQLGADEAITAMFNRREEWVRMHRATCSDGTAYVDAPWFKAFTEAVNAAQSVSRRIAADIESERELLKFASTRAANRGA